MTDEPRESVTRVGVRLQDDTHIRHVTDVSVILSGGGGGGGLRGLSHPKIAPCMPLLCVCNLITHVDVIKSNGKIMATGRQVRQVGIEGFFLPPKI